jgi:TatD DNase family protein
MVDTHCHLDVCEPAHAEIVARAREAGVTRIATVGMNDASIEAALQLADEHEEVFAIVGRHPNSSAGFVDGDIGFIERAAGRGRARAIGETGLDYFRDYAPREDQQRAFVAQIQLAQRVRLPVVIHTREAEADTFALLAEHAEGVTVVLHCFSSTTRVAECAERGWYCSFAGNVTYPKATELQAAARDLPIELLLVETDAPFLAPQPLRGKPNEPANVVQTAKFVAGLRGMDYEALEAAVEQNAARVFGW